MLLLIHSCIALIYLEHTEFLDHFQYVVPCDLWIAFVDISAHAKVSRSSYIIIAAGFEGYGYRKPEYFALFCSFGWCGRVESE